MNRTTGTSETDIEMTRPQLLEWLGLPPDASTEDVRQTHNSLVGYLDSAPLILQPWARRQAAVADAAIERATDAPDNAADAGSDEIATHFDEDTIPAAPAPTPVQYAGKRTTSPTTVLAVVALLAAVVVGVYFMGGGARPASQAAAGTAASAGADGASAAPTGATIVPVDAAKVTELEGKVKANAKDTVAMRDLANIYFQAGEFANAATWTEKVVALEPENTDARLALGAATFNDGDAAAAEKQWREVLRLDPKNAEAHYDLGFLYLGQNPPQVEKAEAEWAKVSELAPGSDLAKTADAHLERLRAAATQAPSAPAKN